MVVAGTGTKSPIFNLASFKTGIPHGINNRNVQYDGLIVGFGSRNLFQYDQKTGSVTSIPPYPGVTQTALEGINDASAIAGWGGTPTQGTSNGFQYSAGAYTTIDYPGTTYTTLGGINDAGTMVGYEDSTKQAFLYNAGNMPMFSLLPPYPGAEYTYGEGINGVGHVVGNYVNSIANGGNSLGFYWNGTSFTSIDCGSHSGTIAWGINDNDQVVGQCQDASLNNLAFLYDAKTGTLTTFNYSGASVTAAYGINDNGQIVGQYSGSKSGGFLASTHAQ